jgi:hypothetical protein
MDCRIEKTSNGIEWIQLGIVPASGSTSWKTNYSFQDTDPTPGISYYRIVIVDNNGLEVKSPIVSVERNHIMNILLYPVPTSELLNIQSKKYINHIVIQNTFGKIVSEIHPQKNNILIDSSNFPSGNYFITATFEDNSIEKNTFIVIK